MTKPKALVICGDGINCDLETAFALNEAGFESARLHVADFLSRPLALEEAKLLAIPGGFSFGDEIASGKVLSLKIKQTLSEALHRFIERGNLLLGICNGFQVLVQMGLLPFSEHGAPRIVSLARNSGGKFINRWTELVVDHSPPGSFFDSLDTFKLPIRHGEGRLALGTQSDENTLQSVKQHAPLRYKDDVNGSFDRIAALCNTTGNVLGLMPHPEAFVRWTQHPDWRRDKPDHQNACPHGLAILRNAAKMVGAQ